ncbi:MAG: symmetrical bis(5'-nucleosyl)-tetraphosphatase [Pseudomonadales bacterium]
MARFAVGDIQGCFEALHCVLEKAAFGAEDELWVAGDLVNRGPDSLGTLRYLKSLGDRCKIVLGNHDLHLLAIASGAQRQRKSDTIGDILLAPDRDELLYWLQRQPLLYRDKAAGYTMVHAGIPPAWTLKQAHALAREVEQVLQSDDMQHFFKHMYGDEPRRWQAKLQGFDRLRTIVNYLTRMRFCNANGELDLADKAATVSSRPGFLPWFQHRGRKARQEKIIFGHWASLEGRADHENVFALDTGCVWGGKLSLLSLDSEKIIQCDCKTSPR